PTVRPSSSIALFFSQSARPPRDLLSFPTRRSSDLYSRVLPRPVHLEISRRDRGRVLGFTDPRHRPGRVAAHPDARALARDTRPRSEEHTSELQSPYDLVCRLLLEKKKTATIVMSIW